MKKLPGYFFVNAACWVSVAVIAIILYLVIFFGSVWGLGLSPDSVSYAQSARFILSDGNLSRVSAHWPPLYPLLLAGLSGSSEHLQFIGRLVQALMLALSFVFIVLLLKKARVHSGLAVVAGLLIALQPSMITAHLFLWTEPGFVVLALLNLLVMHRLIINDFARKESVWLSVIVGTALMMRYAGVFLLITNALVIVSSDSRLSNKIKSLWLSSLPALIPFFVWSWFNKSRGVEVADRRLVFHPLQAEHFLQAKQTFADWFHLPQQLGLIVALALIVICIYAIGTRERVTKPFWLPKIIGFYGLGYIVFLVFSISFVDALTPLDSRILLPLLPPALILIMTLISRASSVILQTLGTASLLFVLILNLPDSYRLWQSSRQHGWGFADKNIQTLPLIQYLKALPTGWAISTNGPEYFQLYLPQQATMLPRWQDPISRLTSPAFEQQVQQLGNDVDALCFFGTMEYRNYLVTADQLNQLPAFKLVYAQADGLLWVHHKHLVTQ